MARTYGGGMAVVPTSVADRVQTYCDENATMDHSIRWVPDRWLEEPGLQDHRGRIEAVRRVSAGGDDRRSVAISRSQVAGFADDVVTLFLAAMVWGHGNNGYGPHRVGRIVAAAGSEIAPRLGAMVAASQSDGPAAAWEAMTRTAKLRWLGPSFGTKVIYFAAVASPPPGQLPLIADINTSWGIWDLTKASHDPIARSFQRRDGYVRYVQVAHRWAEELGCRPDDVERALFEHGKTVPRR